MDSLHCGKIKVLYIDNEEANRNAFRAYFRRDSRFSIVVSDDDYNLFEGSINFDIIIFEQLISNDIEQSILQYKDRCLSKPILIATTSHRDISTLEKIVKDGIIYKYHTKPYTIEEIEKSMLEALLIYTINALEIRLELIRNILISKEGIKIKEDCKSLNEFSDEMKRLQSLIYLHRNC